MTTNIKVTPISVIQVKPGIGDVIWHLPYIHAIAASSPEGSVTFLAPPSSLAKELLQADRSIAKVIYFEHKGSGLQRGINLLRLVALLRRCRFDALWILDRTTRPAVAATLAGIPQRIGLGLGAQRHYITNPGIDQKHFHDQPVDWLRALMAAMDVPLPDIEPNLRLPLNLVSEIKERFRASARPWIVLGIGGSHPSKDWPDEFWLDFINVLRRRTTGTIFLIGGCNNAMRAQTWIDHSTGAVALNACKLSICEAAALLRHADLFVGTDSAPMNLAVAAKIPAFALFGSTPVLTYTKFIHAIQPEDGCGPTPDGMQRISPTWVLRRIESYLNRRDAVVSVPSY